jgi:hypothetical protein
MLNVISEVKGGILLLDSVISPHTEMASCMSGSACMEVSHLLSLSNIKFALHPEQTQTCGTSSHWPHLGHLWLSSSFHLNINFPTPHIPAHCFITKYILNFDLRDSFIALPSASQVDESYSSDEFLSFENRSRFASSACTMSWILLEKFLHIFLSPTQIDHVSDWMR